MNLSKPNSPKIVIIEYGAGNTGSVKNMIRSLGFDADTSNQPDQIREATHLILPGVGHFDHAMANLEQSELIPVIEEKVFAERTPILGICLGVQLFCQRSDEGQRSGLAWLDAEAKRIDISTEQHPNLRLPHIGWNNLNIHKHDPLLFELNDKETRFYFAHSFHVSTKDHQIIIATIDHGTEVTAVIRHKNIAGTQFHPEKSHRFGRKLLENFIKSPICDHE